MRIMDVLGTGLSTREPTLLNALNSDEKFLTYLKDKNPDFKNGLYTMTRGAFQARLKSLGFVKSIKSLKRFWLTSRHSVDEIIKFCKSTPQCSKAKVVREFKLSKNDLIEFIKLSGGDYRSFASKHLPGNLKNTSYKNHKVVRVERLSSREDTGCITVDVYHNFAAGPSVDSLPLTESANFNKVNSFVYLHNSVDEDYIIGVRGGDSGTKIETLPGGSNTAAVEDVAYIQKKLFAALKIPRAYLGYDEALSSKATLAQEDIRFSRTISVIQRTLISELNKIAIVHLYARGFDADDLQNFTLRLSNPSTVAQQQKLELWRTKFEIAGSAPEGQMSKNFIRKEIWGLNDEQCKLIDEDRLKEKLVDSTIEAAQPEGADADSAEGGGDDMFDTGEEAAGDEEAAGGEESAGGGEDLFAADDAEEKEPNLNILLSSDDAADDEDFPAKISIKGDVPIKAKTQLDKILYNRGRIKYNGASKTHMPDFGKMVKYDSNSMSDPFDEDWSNSYVRNPFGETKTYANKDIMHTVKKMFSSEKFNMNTQDNSVSVLTEGTSEDDIADLQEHREILIIDDDDGSDDS
jgi:hypothetical protein